jgi:alkylhydroperoxidase/carboxymuconolactone decarboxylase family protein YurZ
MNNDTGLKPLPPSNWAPDLQPVVEDMGGQPLAVHGLMANHPELLKAWWALRNYTVTGGELSQRQAELVILRVAWHMRNWYEWGSHVQRALAAGLTHEEIERVKHGPAAKGWESAEELLLSAVDELIRERKLGDATLEGLRQYFSERQLLDVIVTQGSYVILGCMLNTWDVALDEHIAAALPEEVRRDRFEKEVSGS